jgi:hypothetical protein
LTFGKRRGLMKIRVAIVGTGAALSLAACGSSTDTAANTTSSSTSTTTSVVTQVVTKTAKAQSAPRRKAKPKRKRQRQPTPAPTPTATEAPAAAGPIMPNVVGKNLDTAAGKLDSQGIRYALNSNGKHVILKFDWDVCSTSPAAGQPVTGAVVLTLGHFTCGA